jgi:hypothetical protein
MASTNSNIFIRMAKLAQERLGRTDFVHPLYCIFKKKIQKLMSLYMNVKLQYKQVDLMMDLSFIYVN